MSMLPNSRWPLEGTEIHRRYEAGKIRVVPIICQSCNWSRFWIKDLVAFPTDGTPLAQIQEASATLSKLHELLRRESGLHLGRLTLNDSTTKSSDVIETPVPEHERNRLIPFGEFIIDKIKIAILDRANYELSETVAVERYFHEIARNRVQISSYVRGRLQSRHSIALLTSNIVGIAVTDELKLCEESYELVVVKGRSLLRAGNGGENSRPVLEVQEFIRRVVDLIVS
jgi:hypothetical protein